MAATPIAGIAYFRRNGSQYQLRGSFKIGPMSRKKEGIAGQDGVHGYKETPTVPWIEGEISDAPGLSITSLISANGETITAELANGKVYVLENAWVSGEVDLDASEGKATLKWEGMSLYEVTA